MLDTAPLGAWLGSIDTGVFRLPATSSLSFTRGGRDEEFWQGEEAARRVGGGDGVGRVGGRRHGAGGEQAGDGGSGEPQVHLQRRLLADGAAEVEAGADHGAARKACPKAIIGSGHTSVEVLFPESKPIPVDSALTVFNGGQKGGTTTFYIHAFFTAPITGAIVTTVKIKKIHNGRYGLKSVASIPKIANGSGSVKSFDLKIGKTYTYKGKKVSVLSAKCADGKLQANASSIFADGTKVSAGIIRTCTSKG
ncbi:MAG TPA: hypothetical protein VHP56_00415 [Solirubrobacterales bacterium]|jgi:hypothetical protein|nr:hypothetical protein [Solirubrobacterales bacterium]